MTEEIYLSIRVIPNTNAIVTLFPAGQFSARFYLAQGVPSNALRVLGKIVVINAIQNTDENCHPYTESPIEVRVLPTAGTNPTGVTHTREQMRALVPVLEKRPSSEWRA